MAANLMQLTIVSAEKKIFSGAVQFVAATGTVGEVGIYPGHTPLLTSLKPGFIHAKMADGKEDVFYVSSGLFEVQPTVVTVLADTAERASDLDEAAALAAKERALQAQADKNTAIDYAKALAEAVAQLRAIKELRRLQR